MKIGLVTPVFPPYAAGMAVVAESHARALAEQGHEVTVFAPLGRDGLRMNQRYHIQSLPPRMRYGNAAYVPALRSYLREGKFDRIVLEYPFLGGAEIFLFDDIPVAPLRLYYHMDLVGKGTMRAVFKTYNRFVLPRVIKKFSRVAISSLDYAKTGLLREIVASNPQKFTEIPMGVDATCLSPHFHAIKHESKKILFVGALDRAHYFKGVPVLLQALSSILSSRAEPVVSLSNPSRDFVLTIIGDGELRPSYEKLATDLGMVSRVRFVGRVSPADLPNYYRAADLVVLPSVDRSEAFGLVLLEAMSSGCAIIASDLPGVRTLVGDNGLLVRPGDAEDLQRKIQDLFSDPGRLARMGARGRQMVEENYTLEKIGEQFASWVCQ